MSVHVYRCQHCGREVLVRSPEPLASAEVARRIEEELRPSARGLHGQPAASFRLRDDIWLSVSEARTHIPREALPERCPACGRDATLHPRGSME